MRVLFAGGGTGGHVIPAIALADELRRRAPETVILFVGSRGRIETAIVPKAGYAIRSLRVAGFRRAVSFDVLKFPALLAIALVESACVLLRFRPDLVVGTGGYVSGPVGLVAAVFGVRLAIHEQNSYPGVTTRLLASWAAQVFLTYPGSARYFKHQGKLHVYGNPVRGLFGRVDRASALAELGLEPSKRTLMITGGSQGAHRINEAALDALPLLSQVQDLQILWLTGRRDYEHVLRGAQGQATPIVVRDFLDDMPSAYAAADLVVSRAGANSLAELTICGVPAILVPLRTAAAHHQEFNARVLADAGAAYTLLEEHMTGEALGHQIMALLDSPEKLAGMREASIALGNPDAASRIVDALLGGIGGGRLRTGV